MCSNSVKLLLIIFSVKIHGKLAHILAILREATFRYFCSAFPITRVNNGLCGQFTEWPAGSVVVCFPVT